MLSERMPINPPTRTKVGGLNPLRISIQTVNVQGIKKCVDDIQHSDTNLNLKGEVGIIESTKDKNIGERTATNTLKVNKVKNKRSLLNFWLNENLDSIIVLTETKLVGKNLPFFH